MKFIAEYNLELTAFGTAIAAVAAVLSAYAAFSSANSAQNANKSSAEAEKRFNCRTALSDAHEIIIECERLKHLSTNLKLEYQSLAVFHGVSGGSREQIHQKAVLEKYERAMELSKVALSLKNKPKFLEEMDINAIDAKQIELLAARREIEMLRDLMTDDLLNIRLQISEARNKVVSK